MKFLNRQLTFKDFLYKTIKYIPLHLKKYIAWVINEWRKRNETEELISLMNGSERDFYIILKKNLARTLCKSYKKVSYWNSFSQLKNVNKKNCFEILQSMPTLTKDIIREQGEKMWQDGKSPENAGTGSTGGTTGSPLLFLRGHNAEDTHQPALYEYITGIKYKGNLDKFGIIVSFDGARPSEEDVKKNIYWLEDYNSGIYGTVDFCSFYLNDESAKYYIDKLNELKPYVIRGYSNAILSMAQFVEKFGGLTIAPKGIYVTSEYCSKESMIYISNAFGCNVYGQYGQSEACLFAWTKPNDDTYYCSPYYGYVEVLDENNNQVEVGEIGEVVVTAFYRTYEQPFIRYRTGDLVKYGGTKNGIVCLSGLKGRKGEYIVGKNSKIIQLVGFIDIHYLKCKDKILSYQIEQNEPGKVVFRIVKSYDWTAIDEEEIRKLLAIREIDVDFEYPKEIPLTSKGKRKNIIQNIKGIKLYDSVCPNNPIYL
ncbi:MAG: hypothetical protein IJ530_04850 [Treponema sp.]|uniref:hypothetical protein n=1 Tax=Treponema sp. TaxID=166 RepID=UPI0025E9AA28|nr:hypothetical protein [Treponema sp.]MBQ8679073.1 hypothetical protein [Treponema sp.]